MQIVIETSTYRGAVCLMLQINHKKDQSIKWLVKIKERIFMAIGVTINIQINMGFYFLSLTFGISEYY